MACFDTNWCSGHGECVGVNVCECEPGWGGEACQYRNDCEGRNERGVPLVRLVSLTPDLPLTEGEPTQCGFCPDAGIACNCGDSLYDQPQVGMQPSLPWPRDVLTIGFFGFYQEYVSRLLLLETTVEMQVSIAATIAKLETIKNLNKRYNPYTEVLEEDMVEWIREIQYVPQEDIGLQWP